MTVRLDPMPDDRLPEWIERSNREYIEARVRSGEPREVAERRARESLDESFPGGRALATHRVFDVVADDEVVGTLWIGPLAGRPDDWWVYDIEIAERHRRRGHARRALELAEGVAAELGASSIGLNVFGYNTGAEELYRSLGYGVVSTQLAKPLHP
jgi:ribosomal protein S18 acetylase RimI-like enzyme